MLLIFNSHLEVPSAKLRILHMSSNMLLPLFPRRLRQLAGRSVTSAWGMAKENVVVLVRGTQICQRNGPTGPHLMCIRTCQFLTGTRLPPTLCPKNVMDQLPTDWHAVSVE